VRAAFLALALCLPAAAAPAAAALAAPPPDRLVALRRGINLTNWFRFPPSGDPAAIRAYVSDPALADLRAAGFTFVRLPVQPEFVLASPERPALLAEAIGRIEAAGLAVAVEVHPTTWHLEGADRARLPAAWRTLAPVLARFDPRRTFPEIVNEPVFAGADAEWEALQRETLAAIRAVLPDATVIATGDDWGSIDGLLRLHPLPDGNVVYSFHFYEPRVLVLLADWAPHADKAALATLPFPVADPCPRADADSATLALMRGYCAERWDAARLHARLGAAAAWGRRNGVPVLMGEFGAIATLNAPARLAWLADTRRAAAALGLGWALWGYDDVMGFNLHRPPGPRPVLNPAVLDALGLVRPSSKASGP
jgi:hypothetical protein